MAKSTAKPQVEGTSIKADQDEGKALLRIWNQTNSLKNTIKPNGFDTRLGKLLQKLKAQSPLDSGQISRQTLATYYVDKIDRRRRSEALWFVENEVEVRDFIKASGFKGSSLTALQAAMRKAAKGSEDQPAKAEPSNVGQSEEAPAKADNQPRKWSQGQVVNAVVTAVEANEELDLEKIIEALIARLPSKEKVAA